MKPTINNIEKSVVEKLRLLPIEKQEEVLDFVQFLLYKSQPTKQFSISSQSSTSPTETRVQALPTQITTTDKAVERKFRI
jgi:hypothetical protein